MMLHDTDIKLVEQTLTRCAQDENEKFNNDDKELHGFFSSRRRHTRYWRDWSSDVCSSDLVLGAALSQLQRGAHLRAGDSKTRGQIHQSGRDYQEGQLSHLTPHLCDLQGRAGRLALSTAAVVWACQPQHDANLCPFGQAKRQKDYGANEFRDRKSTRLNSSHANISYAVFCLKN